MSSCDIIYMMSFSMELLVILLFYTLPSSMAGKSKISRSFRTRICDYSKMKNRQDDTKTELLDKCIHVFLFQNMNCTFPDSTHYRINQNRCILYQFKVNLDTTIFINCKAPSTDSLKLQSHGH